MTIPSPDSPALVHAKKALRRDMAHRRQAFLASPRREMIEDGLRLRMIRMLRRMARTGDCVALVWPLAGECDLRPVMDTLHADGLAIALPETPPTGHPLAFRLWQPGCLMQPGRFGTFHPDGPPVLPDVIGVPLLAFDRRGMRLGYGGGYYGPPPY